MKLDKKNATARGRAVFSLTSSFREGRLAVENPCKSWDTQPMLRLGGRSNLLLLVVCALFFTLLSILNASSQEDRCGDIHNILRKWDASQDDKRRKWEGIRESMLNRGERCDRSYDEYYGAAGNSKTKNAKINNEVNRKNSKNADRAIYKDAIHCVSFDRTSNTLADFIVNSCDITIEVYWKDSGQCRSGCMSGAPAGGRSTVTKLKGNGNFTACQGRSCSPKRF